MDTTLPTLEELQDEKFWRKVVRDALDFRSKASRDALHQLENAIKASGIVVDGFNRAPIMAPTSRLLEGIQHFIGDMELLAAIIAIWMESNAQLVAKGKEYLLLHPPVEENGRKDIVEIARAFKTTNPEVQLEDAALMLSLLAEMEEGNTDKPDSTNAKNPTGNVKDLADRVNRPLERERERNRRLNEENRRLQEEQREKDRQIRVLRREHRELSGQIQAQRDTVEQNVNARIDEIKRKLLLEFSSPTEKETYSNALNDLESAIAFATGAIDRQIAKNSRLGTIHEVREKYRRVSELLAELGKIKDESIMVVPEVDAAIRRLDGIRKMMVQDAAFSRILVDHSSERSIRIDLSWIGNLETIKSSLPVLERVSRLIPELRFCGLLEETGCEVLYDSIKKKIEQIVLKEDISNVPSPGPSSATFDDDVRLGRLKGKDLVIDGNNVLLTTLLPEGEKKIPDFTAQREILNQNVARAAHEFRHVYIVYDGFENSTRTNGNVSLVYTDKQKSKISADDKIAETIGKLQDRIAILATSDGPLINRCPKAYKVLGARDCYDFFMGRNRRG